MTIYCSRCNQEAPDILEHWFEMHGGWETKVRDYEVTFDRVPKRKSRVQRTPKPDAEERRLERNRRVVAEWMETVARQAVRDAAEVGVGPEVRVRGVQG